MTATSKPLERCCLVTVGATVGFKELTEAVLQPPFWKYLQTEGFTSLRIQCGPDIPWASTSISELKDEVPSGLEIEVFDVRKNLMSEEMMLCKAVAGRRRLGLVISHAGMQPVSTEKQTFVLTYKLRHWHNTRCMETRTANHRRTKHQTP